MFSALKLAAAGIVLALFGGLLLAGGVFTPDGERLVPAAPSDVAADPTQTFPTGLFVATDRSDLHLEFLDDGTGHTILYPGSFEVWYTYAVNGDLWTEMTHASPLGSDRQVPATYFWEWDGELLSFEPWGEELNPNSRGATMAHDFRPIPDSRVVVVARTAIPAGGRIFSSRSDWGIVPVADTHPEALRSLQEVFGRTAAVAIGEGQTITPDLLEPAE